MVIEITRKGGPEVLQATERPVPIPDAYEVFIKVSAAGVNRPDVMQRKGLYPPPDGASDIPGLEVSGTIIALGHAVKHLQCGQEVCALVNGGGYAEYCLAAPELCLPVPDGLSLIQAAAIPETFLLFGVIFSTGLKLAQVRLCWFMAAPVVSVLLPFNWPNAFLPESL